MTIVGAVEFEARLDTRGLVKSINELTRTEFSPLTIRVDDRELTRLNKHIEAKRQHIKSVQDYLNNNPITPRSDTGEIEEAIKKIQALKKSVGDLKSNIRISSEIKVTHELKSQKNSNTADLSSLNVSIGRSASRITLAITRSSSGIQSSISASAGSLRSGVSNNTVTLSGKIGKTNSILLGISANIPDAIGKAVKRYSGDGLLTSLIKLPFKMVGSAVGGAAQSVSRGFFEDIGLNVSKGFGAGKGAKEASAKVRHFAELTDKYLIGGIDNYLAAFLAELTRTGNMQKAHAAAMPRLKINEYIGNFQNMMSVAGLQDTINKGEEIPIELLKLIAKETNRTVEQVKEAFRKKPDDEVRNVMATLLPKLNPQDLIQGYINPLMKEFSGFIGFIGKMQQNRAIFDALRKVNAVKALLPELGEDQEGYLQIIGGGMTRKGKGGYQLEASFEGAVPSRKILPIENPDTDPKGMAENDPLIKGIIDLFKQLAPDMAGNASMSDTVVNAITMLVQSLNPMFASQATIDALANILAAQEMGVDPEQIATISYSFGGKDARALAEALKMIGIDAKTLAMAYPEFNASQTDVPNFLATMIEEDALGFVKSVLKLGGFENMSIHSTGIPPGAEAHSYKHYFKNFEQIKEFFDFLGIALPDMENFEKLGDFLSATAGTLEQLTTVLQVKALAETGELDPELMMAGAFENFAKGSDIFSSEIISDFLEKFSHVKKYDTGEGASPEQKAIAVKIKELYDSALDALVKKLDELGFEIPDTDDKLAVAGQLFGKIKLRAEAHGNYIPFLDAIEQGSGDKGIIFGGADDLPSMNAKIEELVLAQKWFRKDGKFDKYAKEYNDSLVMLYANMQEIAQAYIKAGGKKTPEIQAMIDEARQLPLLDEALTQLSPEFENLMGKSFQEENETPRAKRRKFKREVPEWLYSSPGAVVAYNKMVEDVGDQGYVPSLEDFVTVAYGLSGATSFIGEDFVYKNEPGNPESVATDMEVAAYEKLAGRYAPLMYAAEKGKALVVERVKGKPVKDILDELAAPTKESQKTLNDLTLSLEKETADNEKTINDLKESLRKEKDVDKRAELTQQIETAESGGKEKQSEIKEKIKEEEKKFERLKDEFNKQIIVIYENIGRLGKTLQKMGVAHGDLASSNVFQLDDGSYTTIDLGNAIVDPTALQKLQDMTTIVQRAVIDSSYWGVLDALAVTQAIYKGYNGQALPEQEKRSGNINDLPFYGTQEQVPLGSEQEGVLEEFLKYQELAKEIRATRQEQIQQGKESFIEKAEAPAKARARIEEVKKKKALEDEERRKQKEKEENPYYALNEAFLKFSDILASGGWSGTIPEASEQQADGIAKAKALAKELTQKLNKDGVKKLVTKLQLGSTERVSDIGEQILDLVDAGEYSDAIAEKIKDSIAEGKHRTAIENLSKADITQLIEDNFKTEEVEKLLATLPDNAFTRKGLLSRPKPAKANTLDKDAIDKYISDKRNEISDALATGDIDTAKEMLEMAVAGINTLFEENTLTGTQGRSLALMRDNLKRILVTIESDLVAPILEGNKGLIGAGFISAAKAAVKKGGAIDEINPDLLEKLLYSAVGKINKSGQKGISKSEFFRAVAEASNINDFEIESLPTPPVATETPLPELTEEQKEEVASQIPPQPIEIPITDDDDEKRGGVVLSRAADLGPVSASVAQIIDVLTTAATTVKRGRKLAASAANRAKEEVDRQADKIANEEMSGIAKRRNAVYSDPDFQQRIDDRVAEIVATLDPNAQIDEVTLVATGFRGPRNEQNSAEALSKKYQEATGRQGALVPIDSTFTPDVSSDKDPISWAKQAAQKMFGHFFGEDAVLESAEEMAAQAIAYAQVYANAQIKAVGHSAGGVVSQQAKEIAENMGGPNIRAAYVGTPAGISGGPDEQAFMAEGDPFAKVAKLIGMLTNFVKGNSHDFGEYMEGASGALINNFLNKTEAEIKAEQDAFMQQFMKIVAEMSGYSKKEAEAVSTDVFRIPELVLDEERLAKENAKAQYDSDNNVIYVTRDILNAMQSGADNLGEYNDEVMSIIHELRHAFQTDFGMIDVADIGAGVEQAGVELQASAQSIAKGARAAEAARQAGGRTDDELAAIAQLEADAYEFENRATEAIRNIQLDELSGIARILKGLEFKFSDVTESARGFFTALSEGIATANEMDANMSNFLQGIADASPEMAALVENAQGFLETFSAIGLATLAFEKLMEVLPEALDIAAEFEFVKLQMQNIEGSAYGAKQLFDEIKNLANDTGNDLRTTLDGFAQLVAATRGTTLEGGATKQIMESMLTAGAVYGMDAEQMDRAMLAITQTASRGAVSMEELRGQLSESLPGAFQIAARAMNVTDRELTRLIETGSLMSSDFLPKFAKQIELELGGSVQSAVGGLVKKRILYQNKLTEMLHGLGETFAPLEALRLDAMTKGLDLISKHIKTITTAIISAGIYALIAKLAAVPAIAAAMGVGLAAVINLLRVSLIPIIKSVAVGFIQTFLVVKAIEIGIKLLLAVTKGWLGEFNQTNTQKWADEIVDAMKRARKEAKDLKNEIEGVNDSTTPNNNKPGDDEDEPEPKSRTGKLAQESRRIEQQIRDAELANGKSHYLAAQAVAEYQQKNAWGDTWKWITAFGADWNERKEIMLFKDELNPGRDFPKELENLKALLADETRINKIKDLNEQIQKATSDLIMAKNETEKSAILRQIERLNNLRDAKGDEYDTALKEISAKIKNFQKMLDDGIVQNPENKAFLKGKIDEWTKLRDAFESIKKEVGGLQSLSILVDDMNRLSITIDRIASSAEEMSQLDNIEILSKQLEANSIDRFASLNAQLSQSEKQWQRSTQQVSSYQSAILELQKNLGNPAISSELQVVDPLLNKKYMDMNSNELEFAQEGIDDSQQAKIKAIEYLLQLRQAEDDLLTAQVEEMESIVDFQEQQMDQALQIIAIRREDQEIVNQIANAAASVKITRAEFGDAGYNIELERAKQAEAEAVLNQALVFDEMTAIEKAYKINKITAEKYYEEIGRLKSEAAQESMSLAEAELQVKRAAEQKFLEEFRESIDEQRRLRERNHAVAIKQIRELQLARAINPEQAAYQEALANQRNQDNIIDLENRRRKIHNAMVTGRLSKDEGETQINELRDQITQAIQQQSESALQVQQAGRSAAIEAVEQAILESQVAGQMSQVQAALQQAETQVGNSANSPIEQIRAELELIEARRNAAIENAQKGLQTAIQAGLFSSAGATYQEALAQVQNPGNDPLEKLRNLVALDQARRAAMLDDAIRNIQVQALNESWNPEDITLAEAQAKVSIGADDFAQQILNEIELVKAEIAYQLSIVQDEIKSAESRIASENISAQTSVYQKQLNAIKRFGRNTEQVQKETQKRLLDVELARIDKSLKQAEENLARYQDMQFASERERIDTVREAESQIMQLTLERIQKEIEAEEAKSEEIVRIFDKQIARQQRAQERFNNWSEQFTTRQGMLTETLSRQNELFNAQADLVQKLGNFDEVRASNALNASKASEDYIKQLISLQKAMSEEGGNTEGNRYKARVLAELAGVSAFGNLSRDLKEQFNETAKREQQLLERKERALLNQERIQKAQLDIQIAMNALSAKSAVIEAQIANIKAKQAEAEARMQLSKAQRTGNADEVAAARQALRFARYAVELTQEQIDMAQAGAGLQGALGEIQKNALFADQQTAREQFNAEGQAIADANKLKGADLAAEGLVSPRGLRDIDFDPLKVQEAAMKSLSEQTAKAIASSMTGFVADLTQANTTIGNGIGAISEKLDKIYTRLDNIRASGGTNLTVVSNDPAGDVSRIYDDIARSGLMKG